jgi:hypothetical protein
MPREKDTNWSIDRSSNGNYDMTSAHLAVLMDIRDELKSINSVLHCRNFLDLPFAIRKIDRRLAKKIKL